ncbi:MAG TPA: formate/nitrite transporter family protein [Gemmatimonadales bacterium]|nr:formate/nitrite transporter family protein [Gemmatimonadales bacterium]
MTGDHAALEAASEKRRTTTPGAESHRELRHDHPRAEPQKSYHTILEQQMAQAEEELERPAGSLLLSGLTAGLDVGFGPLAMVVLLTATSTVFPKPVQEILAANLYAVGFILVVMGRSALFTEQTASAVGPVLAGRVGVGRLLRLWGLVLVANVAGGAIFALFATRVGIGMGIAEASKFGELAGKLVTQTSPVMFASAIGAGWLMGLLAWLVVASRDSVSQIAVVWIITFVLGFLGLHHSIAGTVEVLAGVFVGQGATLADYARFLVLAVLGNAVGGAFFVAALKFAHIRQSASG